LPVYGYRRIHGDLNEIRETCGKSRELARVDIFDYIEVFCNRVRRHSHLGDVTQEAFEQASS
jgi:putative transposase